MNFKTFIIYYGFSGTGAGLLISKELKKKKKKVYLFKKS
jgi:hypothetical protein